MGLRAGLDGCGKSRPHRVHMYMCVCACVCVYIYIYIHLDERQFPVAKDDIGY